MRVYNSIILTGLLLAGFASNLKSFDYRSAQNLQELNAKQHLVADAEDVTGSSPIPHRGSGRFSSDPNNESLTKDDEKNNSGKEPSRGSGRFRTEVQAALAPQQLSAKNEDKGSGTEPSRGSGRFTTEVHPKQQLSAKNEDKGSGTEPARGSGRLIEDDLINA